MASKVYNEGKKQIADIDWTAATLKALLLMTNTTADTEDDGIATTANFTTLDEHDGAGYARVTLANATITKEDGSDRAKLSCDDFSFATLGAGTRQAAGVLIVVDVAGTLYPISWHEFTTPRDADGGDFVCDVSATNGLITIENP